MSIFRMALRVRFMAADPAWILTRLTAAGVQMHDLRWIDGLTVAVTFPASNYRKVKKYFDKQGISYCSIGKIGILWQILNMGKRPVLVFGVAVFILLAYVASGRIFFVKVTGNERIPKEQILWCAQESGIKFGIKSADIRSEATKNNLLEQLPELQWVGVTTSGCVATVHVKERAMPKTVADFDNRISHIVAEQSGMISAVLISHGNALVSVGQSVNKGDVLISGYTDCGRLIKAEQAEGEVFAYTKRDAQAVSLSPDKKRGESLGEHTCYRLRIGKKVINLCNHSGIQDTTCVKMYSEDYWSLPGSFRLPVALIKERCVYYPVFPNPQPSDNFDWLSSSLREQMLSQLVAGEILDESLCFEIADGVCRLSGEYACHEMIGRVKCEEIVERYAEDN